MTRARGRGIQEIEQAAGMVAIRVGEPDPPYVGGVHHRRESGDEVPVGQAEAGVDHHRLAAVQHEGVDGQEPDAGHLEVVVEDGDVPADSVCVHDVSLDSCLERNWRIQKPFAGRASAECSAELDRVERDLWPAGTGLVGAAGGAGERQSERLPMSACPLRDDIGDEATVVRRRQLDRAVRLPG